MVDTNQCCCCENCILVCPRKAVSIGLNDEGFWYPVVETSKCINCGLCDKSCPIKSKNLKVCEEYGMGAFYGAHNDVHVLSNCSSGGIATALSEVIINKYSGVVYGAAYSSDFTTVKTVRVENHDELSLLSGSKYVPSLKQDAFINIKSDLIQGKKVLYIGLPCEIVALKLFLQEEYSNLYTIDLVCHGPTSIFALRDYLKVKSKRKTILKFNMRYKDSNQWTPYYMHIDMLNNHSFKEIFWESDFGYIFNRFARKSCYSCQFKDGHRSSDITLGDAWGAPKELIAANKRGLSLIIVNSQNGLNLLMESSCALYKADINEIKKGNPNLVVQRQITSEWDIIAKNLRTKGITKTVRLIKPIGKRFADSIHKVKNKILGR